MEKTKQNIYNKLRTPTHTYQVSSIKIGAYED